jgi:23S rRNA pseudouridine1911/1915/1917 synthase
MKAKNSTVEVLFEDNHLLVVNKPAGIVTQQTASFHTSLEQEAKDYIKQKYKKPGSVFLHAIHRLDRLVSGIVVFARTSKALVRLNEAAKKEDGFVKIYLAIVENELETSSGILEHMLVHGDSKAYVHESGKKSLLSFTLITSAHGRSFVKIRLYTGRYHQIRAQFSAIGHPIAGDVKYGGSAVGPSSIALHNAYIKFTHPTTQEEIALFAPLPKDAWWKEFPVNNLIEEFL